MKSEGDDNVEMDPETTCTECYAEFLDPEDLQVHIRSVHRKKTCHFCPYSYLDPEKYVIHLRDEHVLSLRSCKFCTRMFTNTEARNAHEKMHIKPSFSSPNIVICSQCPVKFNNVLNLEQHEIDQHSNVPDGVFLNKYYSLLSSVLNIKALVFIQSLGTNVTYMCTSCNYSTSDENSYIDHLKEKNCKCVACDGCSKVYKTRKSLVHHYQTHKECFNFVDEDTKFKQCSSCYKMIEKINLRRHMENCKSVKCTMCSVSFPTVQELSKHQSAEHPLAISLTICSFCHKEFVGSISLNKHIDRSHRPDFHLYKYACVYCEPKYFKHPKDLFGHFFSKHQELQPYSCKICDKTFRVRKRFTIHIKLEHGSVGFVEFDKNYHVFFTDKKSENPFQPTSLIDPNQFPSVSKPIKPLKKMGKKRSRQTDVSETEQSDINTERNKKIPDQTDGDWSEQTDLETEKKPPKKRFKFKAAKDFDLVNVNSDFMSATETEAVQTETESKREQPKRKIKLTKRKREEDLFESDDDEPLVNVKKKCSMIKKRLNNRFRIEKKRKYKDNKRRLTCKICDKYCYTQQNYRNHMGTHSNKEIKKCVKCSMEFKTVSGLKKHIQAEHSSSRLTETLKTLLERRKQGSNVVALSPRERFLRTIRQVKTVKSTPAKISEVDKKLSVQTFIENFSPESGELKNKGSLNEPAITITQVNSVARPPAIKIHKFKPKPPCSNIKLAMPVRFKNPGPDKTKATIKLIPYRPVITESYSVDDSQYQESVVDYEEAPESPDRSDTVPEVAQEVMLGTDEAKPQVIPHKIIIPKLPEGYTDIRVAHLQPEAPYFKIVKINDLGKSSESKGKNTSQEKKQEVTLPTGTKLVTVNPLAHLLGDTPVEKIVGEKNKYYKSKRSNYQEAIAKALLNLENKNRPKRNLKKKKVEVEQ